MKRLLHFFTYILISYFSLALTAQAQQSIIELQSDSGDWIGGGVDRTLTGTFNIAITESLIDITHPEQGFNFEFAPISGNTFQVGSYLNVQRLVFRGPLNPGMDVSSPGRGCNTISGEFHIYELDLSGQEPRVAMDFVQFCSSQTDALRGQIRINSDIQVPYPLPVAVIVPEHRSLIEGQSIQMNGTKSFSKLSDIVSYSWSQLEGPTAITENEEEAILDITLPTGLPLGGENFKFGLTVTDSLGQTDTKEIDLHIASKSDPQSYFWMDSEAGDYIGAGRYWEYNLTNSKISMARNYDNGVNVGISGEENWTASFAAPDDVQLEVGVYEYAERFPFQSAGVAGLTISGNGRGCNQSYGAFEVLSLDWNNDEPVSFKAKFEQRCEQVTAPLLVGEVWVNAYHESVPTADAGEDFTLFENEIANLDGSASFDSQDSELSFLWASDVVSINSASSSRAHFVTPTLADRQESQIIQVELLVSDSEGYMSKDEVKVNVLANNQPPTANDDQANVNAGETVELYVLDNDVDDDGEIKSNTISITQQPSSGSIIITEEGMVIYTSSASESLEDHFYYTVRDNDDGVSNEAQVIISVTATGDDGTDDDGTGDDGTGDGGTGDDGTGDDGTGDDGTGDDGTGGGSTNLLLLLILSGIIYLRRKLI